MSQGLSDTDRALLDAWLDGQLDGGEQSDLESRLAQSVELRREADELRRLFAGLALPPVPVRDGFAGQVMAALPRRSSPRAFVAALFAVAALAAVAALLGSGGSGLVLGSGSILATLGDFLGAGLLAGAGLVGASWQGAGDLVRSLLDGSVTSWSVAAALVLASNLLLFRLLRRRHATARARRDH